MVAILGLLLEFVLLAAMKASGMSDVGDGVALFLIVLFTAAFIASVQRDRRLRRLKMPLMQGYFWRLFLLLFDRYGRGIFELPNASGDAENFYSSAVEYSQYGGWTRTPYPQLMGTIFRYIGTNRLYGQFVSMLFSIVALVFLAYTLHELSISESTKNRVYRTVCLLPNFAILSMAFIREGVITMFLTFSFYCFIHWTKRKQERYFLFAVLWVIPAARFHSGTIAALIGYMAIRFIYDNRGDNLRITFSSVLLGLLLVMAASFLFINYGDALLEKFGNIDSIDDIANTNDTAGSSYARYVGNSNNPLNMVIFTLPRMIYFLFSPFPWQWRGLGDLIAFFFSGLYYLMVIIDAVRYLRQKGAPNHAVVFALFVLALVTSFVFGWGCSNSGTAARHRDKLVTLFALLWALSTDGQTRRRRVRIV